MNLQHQQKHQVFKFLPNHMTLKKLNSIAGKLGFLLCLLSQGNSDEY